MKHPLGLSTCFYDDCTPENWQQAATAGFTDVELCLRRELPMEELLSEAQKNLAVLKAVGLRVTSTHLPFDDNWEISGLDPHRREAATEQLERLLQWAGDAGIGIAVLHPSFEPIPPEERAERLEISAESIRRLAARGGEAGVRLAVENLPRTCLGNCADEMLLLTDCGRNASICMDVNHLLRETHREFIEKAGKYIVTTHLSDYDRVDERHWFVGDGCIDWRELTGLLEKAGYAGRYLFEIREGSSATPGFTFTPGDLAERFRALISPAE